MKKILVLAFVVLTAINLCAQNTTEAGVSGSPYLMIIKDNPAKIDVELTKTDVDVNISGVIADITVRQYYRSVSDQVLEAVYVFPASVHAAVYSMKMKIGSREIMAVIKEKEQARKDYEQAKLTGKRASLLVQDRPNLFQMNLANIAPGDLIEIEMKYTEMLVPDDKIYTFSFPTIAAPRYGGGNNENVMNEKTALNQQDKRYVSNSTFDIKFNLISPVPIDGIECITHEVNYGGETANHSLITLKDSEKKSAPKDFVVKYKLAGDLINSGLLLSKGEGKNAENFFLLTVQPPKRIDPAYIPPREYIFVLDVSGSMNGFPAVMAKKTILNLIDKLDKDDKFNLILFASGFDVFSENLVTANRDNLEKAFKFIAESHQGGGTELLPALEKVLTMPKDSKASRSIVVITDGLIDFESKAFELIRDNLNKANLFTFGIGTSMNKLTIEGMARAGNGLAFETNRLEDAEYQSERFIKYISSPILADIKVTYDGFGISEVEPMSVPDLFPDRPIVIYGKWDGNLQGGIKIEAINGQEGISVDLPVTKFGEMVQGDALKQLWARKQIELLSDYQSFGERDKYKKEITDLGLKYSLMTAYTSFIALDNEVVPNFDKINQSTNKKPDIISPGNKSENKKRTSEPVPAPDSKITLDMQEFAPVDEVERASAEGGTGIDEGGFSASIDFSEKTVINESIEENPVIGKFIPVEEMPKIADYGALKKSVIYPEFAKRAGIEGKVIVAVWIDKNGKPTRTKILNSPNSVLDQAAIDAVMNYDAYTPAIQNNKPVGCWLQIPISFALIASKNPGMDLQNQTNIDNEKPDFNFIFYGKPYEMIDIKTKATEYSVANLKKGTGKNIKIFDTVKFACSIYNDKQELIKTDTITVIVGIGETAKPIDAELIGMQEGCEKLLIFPRFYLFDCIYPTTDKTPYIHKLLFKIKVLEINPK